jgi:effector-binding domain-containing protein
LFKIGEFSKDEEYKEANPEVEIAIPVDTLGDSDGEFIYKEYSAIPPAAVVRFSGPFNGGYDAASEKLASWMESNGYAFAGPLRGHVLTSPDEDSNSANWMTELQAPVIQA